MPNIKLVKFTKQDFNDYYSLVSNEQVMAMITERALSFEEAKRNFNHFVIRNEQFEHFGNYKVYDSDTGEILGSGNLKVNEKRLDEAEIGYMLLPSYWG